MKKISLSVLALVLVSLFAAAVRGVETAPTFDDAMKNAEAEYRGRMTRAAEELNRTRARVAAEKAPLLEQMRAAEDRVIAAESESARMEMRTEDVSEQRRKLLQELESIRKTTAYANTLAHDSLKAVEDTLAPGEEQFSAEQIDVLQKRLDDAAAGSSGRAAMDIAEFLVARTERALGGYRAEGRAMIAETNQVLPGTFVFVGPETFFLATQGGVAGAVRPREGAKFPTSYTLTQWKAEDATAFFAGRPGTIVADASGGKALRLRETTGTVWEHVRKGGLVAFAIVGVGILAVAMILQKVRDLSRMAVDSLATVATFLETSVMRGANAEASNAAKSLKRTTQELFLVGLRYADQPKVILEERLQAVLLAQRLHYERRLPLLAVIATASPLMGLLGTVVGMVKTFALITVFGTGNAAKLSTGISEVLVATELGLVVAIPTLIAHGFLAHRIQKNLLLLERHALEFATAVETAKVAANGRQRQEPITTT